MKKSSFLALSIVLSLLLCLSSPAANVAAASNWHENFDSYTSGTQIIGSGGWVPWWDIDPEQDALVSTSQSRSASNSLAITGPTDIVRPFSDAVNGRWVLTMWQYIPETFNELTNIGLLNQYNPPSTASHSMWICFDASTGLVYDEWNEMGTPVPLVKGAWKPIRIEIDLDYMNETGENVGWHKVYYDSQLIYESQWDYAEMTSIAALEIYSSDSGLSGTVYYDDMSLENPYAPGNDNYANAAVITGTSGTDTVSNIGATWETGEPWIADIAGIKTTSDVHSLWWSWTAPQDGNVLFNTIGSSMDGIPNMDTIMSVYTGTNISSLIQIARNDDCSIEDQTPDISHNSSLVFKAVSGTTYYLAADGCRNETGEIVLNWAYVTPPANDDFPGTTITGTSGTAAGDNSYATRESGEPHHIEYSYSGYTEYGQSSIWWTWTAPESGVYFFDNGTQGDPPYVVIAIYTGDSVSTLSLMTKTNTDRNHFIFEAVAGTTYHIVTDGEDSNYGSSLGALNLYWHKQTAPNFTSTDNTTFKAGTNGSFIISADGYPAPSISHTYGTLPSGITFNGSTNTLGGTPAAGTGGSYSVEFTATNKIIPNATQNFTLTVNEAPRITSTNSATFSESAGGSFTVSTSGYPTSSTVTLDAGTLPSGVTFNSSTKTLSGTPATGTSGIYSLTFKADNGVTPFAEQSFTLYVNGPPKITDQPQNAAVTVGATTTFTVGYAAQPAASFQWQLSTSNGSKWANIAGTSATLASYTTPVTTTRMNGYQYRVIVSNGYGSPVVSSAAILTVMPGTFETADLSIEKMDGIYEAATGSITWTIQVNNEGTTAAAGIKITDSLQSGTRLMSIDLTSIPGASSKVRGRNITVDIGQLAPGTSVTFTITVNASRATSPVLNTVVMTTTTSYDPILTNNTDTAGCTW